MFNDYSFLLTDELPHVESVSGAGKTGKSPVLPIARHRYISNLTQTIIFADPLQHNFQARSVLPHHLCYNFLLLSQVRHVHDAGAVGLIGEEGNTGGVGEVVAGGGG